MLQRCTHKHAEVYRHTKINRGSMNGVQLGVLLLEPQKKKSGFNCSSKLDPNSYSKGTLRREEKAHPGPETRALETHLSTKSWN